MKYSNPLVFLCGILATFLVAAHARAGNHGHQAGRYYYAPQSQVLLAPTYAPQTFAAPSCGNSGATFAPQMAPADCGSQPPTTFAPQLAPAPAVTYAPRAAVSYAPQATIGYSTIYRSQAARSIGYSTATFAPRAVIQRDVAGYGAGVNVNVDNTRRGLIGRPAVLRAPVQRGVVAVPGAININVDNSRRGLFPIFGR